MNETRIKKGKRNLLAGLFQFAASLLLTWIGRIVFVQILSADYLGINGLFANVINVLSLADLGIGTAMAYSLYQPLKNKDHDSIISLVAFFRKIYLFIAGAVLLIGLLLIPALPYIVNLERPVEHLTAYYLLALGNTVISYLFVYRTVLLTADQKSFVLQYYLIAFRLITVAAQILTLIITRNYLIYLAVELLFNLICNLFQNRAVIRHYPFLLEKAVKLNDRGKRSILNNIKDLFLYRLCGVIQGNTDSILISVMIGTVFVGYYSNYLIIISAVTSLVTLLFSSIKASVGNMFVSDDTSDDAKLRAYWMLELANFWTIGFCTISFVCLFEDFILASYGAEYVLRPMVVIAMALNFYTSNIRQTLWTFRETTGVFHETRFVTAVTAGLNLVLSIVLGYFAGMFGILIATVIARMIYAWWKEPIILFHRVFHTDAKRYFQLYGLRFAVFALACISTYFLCGFITFSNPVIRFLLKSIVCVIVPNLIFFIASHRCDEYHMLIQTLIPARNNDIQADGS